jgi:hypothetical protein
MCPSGASQRNEDAPDASSKKRKLNSTGRPIRAVNKAKALSGKRKREQQHSQLHYQPDAIRAGPQDAGKMLANNNKLLVIDVLLNGDIFRPPVVFVGEY